MANNMNDFFNDPDNNFGDASDGFEDFEGFSESDDSFGDFGDENSDFGDASDGFGDFGDTNEFGAENSEEETDDEFNLSGNNNESYNIGNYTPELSSTPPNEPVDEKKKNMKVALMLGVTGIAILIVTLTIANMMGKKPKTVKPQYEDKSSVMQDSGNKAPVISNQSTMNTGSKWTKLDKYSPLNDGTEIESSFTITNIEYYAIVSNGQQDKQVKTVLTGNISGLVGTYEIEVPYLIGGKLNIGNSFNITYSLIEANGYKVIDSIKY